ncbi:MAG: outer membrane beta-barrel protein, partial [Gammaproteobacteria bacterium]|nr:outer membrane beta-barrel protein [Gammaproteobacteria bacterium]
MLRRKAITATALGASLLLGHAVAQAAEEVGQAYLKGMGSYISADDDRHVDDGFAGGLAGFGYALSEHFNVEFEFQRLDLDGDGAFTTDGGEGGPISTPYPDQDQTAINVNLVNIYNRDGMFSPFILAGLGVVNTDINNSDGDDLQGQL